MLATDPLSLVFLGCLLFAGVFLLVSLVTGMGHGHLFHAGHVSHVAGAGHAGAPHLAHGGHATAHAGGSHVASQAGPVTTVAPQSPLATLWSSTVGTLAGSLNLLSVLTFLFCFGLFGYLLHNISSPGPFLTLFLPAVLGAGAAVGVGTALTRLFAVSTGEVTAEGTRIEGRVGTVSMAIEPGRVGEVIFARAGGGRQSIGARSHLGEALEVGAEVVILAVDDGIASVESWDTFMRHARSGASGIPSALDPPQQPTDGA
jgi:hypothetical protein